MGTLSTKLQNILNCKVAIKNALVSKGLDMTNVDFSHYSNKITELSSLNNLNDVLKSQLTTIGWTTNDINKLEAAKWWKKDYDNVYEIDEAELDQYDFDKADGISLAEFQDGDYGKAFKIRFVPKLTCENGDYTNLFKGMSSIEASPSFTIFASSIESAFEDCNNLKYLPEMNTIECYNFKNAFKNCCNLQTIEYNFGASKDLNSAFSGCTQLHTITSEINYKKVTTSADTFKNCVMLKSCKIKNLNQNLDLSDCGHLSKESLLYMIQNAGSNIITITLNYIIYYSVYDGDADLLNAVAAKNGSLIINHK